MGRNPAAIRQLIVVRPEAASKRRAVLQQPGVLDRRVCIAINEQRFAATIVNVVADGEFGSRWTFGVKGTF